jgi:hypothetical protein
MKELILATLSVSVQQQVSFRAAFQCFWPRLYRSEARGRARLTALSGEVHPRVLFDQLAGFR